MAVAVYKTFSSGEILTAADLNSSFTQITNNGEDLAWPATKAKDLNGFALIVDADGDSDLREVSDDLLAVRLQGVNLFRFDGDATSPVNGLDFRASATGADVVIVPQGSDTDIDLDLQSKGAGSVLINGSAVSGVENDDNILATQVYT